MAHQGTSVLTLAKTQRGDIISQGRDGTVYRWDIENSWEKSGTISLSDQFLRCTGTLKKYSGTTL